MAPARLSLLLVLGVAACAWGQEAPQTPDWRMTLKTIRNGVHKIDTYLNAALDLLGGEDGLCQYKCGDGERGRRRDPCPGQGRAGAGPSAAPGQTSLARPAYTPINMCVNLGKPAAAPVCVFKYLYNVYGACIHLSGSLNATFKQLLFSRTFAMSNMRLVCTGKNPGVARITPPRLVI